MILKYIFCSNYLFIFLITKAFTADFIMNCYDVDKFPVFEKIDSMNTFAIYSNQMLCTTNTSMLAFSKGDGIVETVDGKQLENIMNKFTDRCGHIGYIKAVPAEIKHYRENDRDFSGASINTWQWIGGTGPFANFKSIIMTRSYLQLGKNKHGGENFIWKGIASGVSENIIQSINNFTKKTKK